MKKHIALFALFIALPASLPAQGLSGSVSAETDYLPTLRNHTRLSALPSLPDLSLPYAELNIASKGVPTKVIPQFAPLAASPWNADKEFSSLPGYFQLGGGSYLNFSGSAGYRFVNNASSTLGVWLQHSSTSAFEPGPVNSEGESLKRTRMDESAGLYLSHRFEGIGTLSADIAYHFAHFNYYHENTVAEEDFPKQNLNDLRVRVGFRPSVDPRSGWTGYAELSDRFFGYNNAWNPSIRPAHENDLQLSGFGAYRPDESTSIGVKLLANLVGYGYSGDIDTRQLSDGQTYGRIALTPYYSFSSPGFSAHIGARFDLTPGIDESEGLWNVSSPEDFSAFHVAPDIRLSASADKIAATLSATGGTELRTMAADFRLDYYRLPIVVSARPLFSPLNARLGVELGDFSGLSASLALAYKITDNMLAGLMAQPAGDLQRFYKLKGYSLEGSLAYVWADKLNLRGKVAYQPQHGDKGFFNGYDRPRWVLDASADINPWDSLRIGLGYEYRGVRSIWMHSAVSKALPDGEIVPLEGVFDQYRLPDLTNLYLSASYTFSGKYSLWLRADNLLGTKNYYGPSMPGEGTAVIGGFSVLF